MTRWCSCLKAPPVSTCPTARSASWAVPWSWASREDMLGRVFDGLGRPIDGGPEILPDARMDINGLPMNPAARNYPAGVHPDRRLRHRRPEHPGPRPEAADLLRPPACPTRIWRRRSPVRQRSGATTSNFAVVFAAMGITFEESELLRSNPSRRPAPLTGPSCSSTWPTTRPSSVSRRPVWR